MVEISQGKKRRPGKNRGVTFKSGDGVGEKKGAKKQG